eukprot:PLAT15923.1.p2 GENE.PLAT15923.1~~PLAT15923.1.p2  ORF type:complete len:254 (+),score=104.01 PLAT15923.1:78-764(+)
MADFGDLKTAAGVNALNGFLATRSYISGFAPSQADVTVFVQLAGLPAAEDAPHAHRWYKHIASFSAFVRSSWAGDAAVAPAGEEAKAAPAAAAAADDGDDSDDDLFGSDDEDDEAEAEAARERARKAKERSERKAAEAKSQILWEIKPWEVETDLNDLSQRIRGIEMDGLTWGVEHKLEPVAFGINKLIMSCVIFDQKIPSTEDITDKMEELFEDEIQSIDIAAFNKL